MPADALATFRSQGISRHGIDPQSWNIPSSVSAELTPVQDAIQSVNISVIVFKTIQHVKS